MHTLRFCGALVGCLTLLAACSPSTALRTLSGAANVAANVQAGATNVQSVGQTSSTDQRIEGASAGRIEQNSGDSQLRAERVETVVVHEVPAWLIIAFAVALFLDSPLRWPEQIAEGFRRSRKSKT